MKELKVGERVTIEVQEEAKESVICTGCCFNLGNLRCVSPDIFGDCRGGRRSDGKNVIFKEVKE